MSTLYIFNPEHDLCLANGDPNYMPPKSALTFGEKSAYEIMGILYGSGADIQSVNSLKSKSPDWTSISRIVPWGWNPVLKNELLKSGAPDRLLPSDEWLHWLKSVQHRANLTDNPLWQPLRPATMHKCLTLDEVRKGIARYGDVVIKAPLSGSGRGLKWIHETFNLQEKDWIEKNIQRQGCVMLEKRQKIVVDFAWEFQVEAGEVKFIGYSLFLTQNGVYRSNYLLSDCEIIQKLGELIPEKELEEKKQTASEILKKQLNGKYEGPVGIDLFIYEESGRKNLQMSEVNYRHTMGMVAHEARMNGKKFFIPTI